MPTNRDKCRGDKCHGDRCRGDKLLKSWKRTLSTIIFSLPEREEEEGEEEGEGEGEEEWSANITQRVGKISGC